MDENVNEIGTSQKDVRTISTDQFYKTKMCPHMNKPEGCLRKAKESCPYAHVESELRSPPNLVKTAMCKLFLKQSCGKTSSECTYAHQYEELRHTESFYKTFVCKFWTAGHCKAGDLCRYAHGEEELRNANLREEKSTSANPSNNPTEYTEMYYNADSFETKATSESTNEVVNHVTPSATTYPLYHGYVSGNTPREHYKHMVVPQYQTLGGVTLYNPISKRCDECYYLMQYYLQRYIDCCTQYHG